MKNELRHCEKCNQMTNHRLSLELSALNVYECLKCGYNHQDKTKTKIKNYKRIKEKIHNIFLEVFPEWEELPTSHRLCVLHYKIKQEIYKEIIGSNLTSNNGEDAKDGK